MMYMRYPLDLTYPASQILPIEFEFNGLVEWFYVPGEGLASMFHQSLVLSSFAIVERSVLQSENTSFFNDVTQKERSDCESSSS